MFIFRLLFGICPSILPNRGLTDCFKFSVRPARRICGLSPPLVETLDRFYLPLGRAGKTCPIQSPVSHWLETGAERNACSLQMPHWAPSIPSTNWQDRCLEI